MPTQKKLFSGLICPLTQCRKENDQMYMQEENRMRLGIVFGLIILVSIAAPFGYLLIKNWKLLNLNIITSVLGGTIIIAGAVTFMIWPKSPAPAFLVFAGLAEQGLMLLLYLDVKPINIGIIMVITSAIIVFCIAGIRQLQLDVSDRELEALDTTSREIPTYEYEDIRYRVLTKEEAALKSNNDGIVVDIRSAKKPTTG